MIANLVMGTLFLAQAGSLAAVGEMEKTETHEVAYETLAAGEARQAIANLEALREQNPGDPALLINLGSAYAELGDTEAAARYYRAAAESEIRYQLELADGTWVDSRRAARTALLRLEESRVAMN